MHKRNPLNVIFLYSYAFFVIYTPELKSIIGIESRFLLIALFILLSFMIFIKEGRRIFVVNKKVLILFISIFLSSLYFAFRALLEGTDTRILQNNYILLQMMHAIFLVGFLKSGKYSREEMFTFVLNLAVIQSIICLLMIMFPSFREIAFQLYYNGREENIFISSARIYGISADYTFFTPTYHGMLGAVSCFLGIFYRKRYFLYSPFILVTILLNGRIGLIVWGVSLTLVLIVMLIKSRYFYKTLVFIFVFSLLVFLISEGVQIALPSTYRWLASGVQDTIKLISGNEVQGNYGALLNTMLQWPDGTGLIWGEGYRVFGSEGKAAAGFSSDIGYVNDMFMGGIIYIILLYIPIFCFIFFSQWHEQNRTLKFQDIIISSILVVTLIVSNYKGESMHGNLILVGAFLMKIILMQENKQMNTKDV